MNDKPTADEIANLANNPNKMVQGSSGFIGQSKSSETVEHILPEDFELTIDNNKMHNPQTTATVRNVSAEYTEESNPLPTWTLGDKTYNKFLFDGTGEKILPIIENGETLGHIGAKFRWEKAEPFLEALDRKDENFTDYKTQATKTKSRNANIALAKLFREIIVEGFMSELDEFGNETTTDLTGAEIIAEVPQEFQSKLVFEFLNAFNAERYYKPGTSKLKQLMRPDDGEIRFLCTLGQFAWLMEFKVPKLDARRAYENRIVVTEKTSDDKGVKVETSIDNKYKRQFAVEHFLGVQGISLEIEGQDYDATKTEHKLNFRKFFPATWWVVLADKLANCFDKAGK
jgi:hypothetical protein